MVDIMISGIELQIEKWIRKFLPILEDNADALELTDFERLRYFMAEAYKAGSKMQITRIELALVEEDNGE